MIVAPLTPEGPDHWPASNGQKPGPQQNEYDDRLFAHYDYPPF
ncbi:hypothetical protein ACI2L1_40995 [Streptomyces sp. NPDC019531]